MGTESEIMNVIIVVCDNYKQFLEYCSKHRKRRNSNAYIPVFNEDTIRKILGIERQGIEIRIIGDRAIMAFTSLRGGF